MFVSLAWWPYDCGNVVFTLLVFLSQVLSISLSLYYCFTAVAVLQLMQYNNPNCITFTSSNMCVFLRVLLMIIVTVAATEQHCIWRQAIVAFYYFPVSSHCSVSYHTNTAYTQTLRVCTTYNLICDWALPIERIAFMTTTACSSMYSCRFICEWLFQKPYYTHTLTLNDIYWLQL